MDWTPRDAAAATARGKLTVTAMSDSEEFQGMRILLKNIGRGVGTVPLVLAFGMVSYGATLYSFDLGSGSTINATDGSRTNVDFINSGGGVSGGGFINGETITMPAVPPGEGAYLVTSISVYAVDNLASNSSLDAGDAAAAFAAEFGTISLYEGPYCDFMSPAGQSDSCNFSSVATSPTITEVSYASSANANACLGYLSTDQTTCANVYQITFTGLNLIFYGGQQYSFAADGSLSGSLTGCIGGNSFCGWYNLASSGGPNSGVGGGTYNWDGTDLTGGSVNYTSQTGNVDFNFDINGSILAPEPASLVLSGLGIGLIALAAFRRREASRKTAG